MGKGVYLIDPGAKSGMLDDGTEFVKAPCIKEGGLTQGCFGCIGDGKPFMCASLPICVEWDAKLSIKIDSWIFVRKE